MKKENKLKNAELSVLFSPAQKMQLLRDMETREFVCSLFEFEKEDFQKRVNDTMIQNRGWFKTKSPAELRKKDPDLFASAYNYELKKEKWKGVFTDVFTGEWFDRGWTTSHAFSVFKAENKALKEDSHCQERFTWKGMEKHLRAKFPQGNIVSIYNNSSAVECPNCHKAFTISGYLYDRIKDLFPMSKDSKARTYWYRDEGFSPKEYQILEKEKKFERLPALPSQSPTTSQDQSAHKITEPNTKPKDDKGKTRIDPEDDDIEFDTI